MPRPPIPEHVVRKVETIWAENPKMTARDVHRAVMRAPDTKISLRKVQQILGSVRKRGSGAWTPAPWTPWPETEEQKAEDMAAIFEMNGLWLHTFRRPILSHEAMWTRRLRGILAECNSVVRFEIVANFARRSEIANQLTRPPYTEDLDVLLSFRPWLSAVQFVWYVEHLQSNPTILPEFLLLIQDRDVVMLDAILILAVLNNVADRGMGVDMNAVLSQVPVGDRVILIPSPIASSEFAELNHYSFQQRLDLASMAFGSNTGLNDVLKSFDDLHRIEYLRRGATE